jgi:hypothetical protein
MQPVCHGPVKHTRIYATKRNPHIKTRLPVLSQITEEERKDHKGAEGARRRRREESWKLKKRLVVWQISVRFTTLPHSSLLTPPFVRLGGFIFIRICKGELPPHWGGKRKTREAGLERRGGRRHPCRFRKLRFLAVVLGRHPCRPRRVRKNIWKAAPLIKPSASGRLLPRRGGGRRRRSG